MENRNAASPLLRDDNLWVQGGQLQGGGPGMPGQPGQSPMGGGQGAGDPRGMLGPGPGGPGGPGGPDPRGLSAQGGPPQVGISTVCPEP